MDKLRPAALVALASCGLLTACLSGVAPDAAAPRSDAEIVIERQRSVIDAFEAADAERAAGFFAPDAAVHVADLPPVEGRDAVRELFRRTFGFLSASELTPLTLRVSNGGGMAYGTGRTSNEFRDPSGVWTYDGKYVMVWERRDDEWQIVLYSISSDHPEPRTQDPQMTRGSGTFEVTITPADPDDAAGGNTLGRSRLEKRYRGTLDATADGQMLTALTAVDGSAVYVAIERVTGTLAGRSGSFVLHHRGVMSRGAQDLVVRVVPDSGTGELEGLEGTMDISIDGGEHRYEFEYTLPDTRE